MEERHGKHYLVFNLSDRDYDTSYFGDKVIVCGFADHHSPSISLMWAIYSFIDLWMAVSPENVIAAHCLAGKLVLSSPGFLFPSFQFYHFTFLQLIVRKGSYWHCHLLHFAHAGLFQQIECPNHDGICECCC